MTTVLLPASVLVRQQADADYPHGSYRVGRTGIVIPAEQLRQVDDELYEWRIKK